MLIWVVVGIYNVYKLPIDAVPDITNNQVQIITNAPTLATQEVEQFVTYPIERTLANIPHVEEIRSISRLGLSVITIVFDEDVDIYFGRQLINERIQLIAESLPNLVAKPYLAPVSTGLGEVYQYVLYPKEGYEHNFSLSDLRTIHEWQIIRQLYGIEGVAEVNNFGGSQKQYEVALDPNRLRAMDVSVSEIIQALSENNQNTGAAYIDKKPNAYFIRSIGLVQNLDDIGQIEIKKSGNVPILIRDVGTPQFGTAIRYGALTLDGEREVVGGVVMMLKGANSKEVCENVEHKIEQIKSTLPEGVVIEKYLDRSSLVDRAMDTVKNNLVEGALIVIFVLVLFLGNWRAGLIVASAIPLSLMFAISLMNLFGVSANLMSLGAIDFGLVIDSAVIITEASLHFVHNRKDKTVWTQSEMDEAIAVSSVNIRKSAAFGEIIILIVYLPILALVGVEGKMFKPMAQTVVFAILGSLILSLTYIPMMCALCFSKKINHNKNFSDRIMERISAIYTPLLIKALSFKKQILALTLIVFAASIFLFSRMGSEFIPQLQEGDLAFHCILPQGASLSQSIETSMKAAKIAKSFPEVKHVVCKTGSAEVPTDPMPVEATDMIITLKEKKDWVTTNNYFELSHLIEEKLSIISGVFIEANQPIQMRFNELMTGVRQDIAIKIFGENMDTLLSLATNIAKQISSVEGISAPQIERIQKTQQIVIKYDRAKMATYMISISDVNQVLTAAFAGLETGFVYEDEKKFDLVVRLDSNFRNSIEDVASLYINTPEGSQIPLSQLATIQYEAGPSQISREDAKRRVVIGFNVTNNDIEGSINQIKSILSQNLSIPPGYEITYGGNFENLEAAKARLSLVVPLALVLIFVLLYFTFHSIRQSLLVFTAIPFASIGGILALYFRGMPFSISAAIGFIALFGVAVLNGIVLISTFNQLKNEGFDDVNERIFKGTHIRLRPVLMTALVASLGFLPMALSTGAGAEVQKPLATVVIGGLVSATLLTLFLLPILYGWKGLRVKFNSGNKIISLVLLLFFTPSITYSQSISNIAYISTEFDSILSIVKKNNPQIRLADLEVEKAKIQKKGVINIPNTNLFYENEDLRPSDPIGILKVGIQQQINWPGVYIRNRKVANSEVSSSVLKEQLTILDMNKRVASAYYETWYLKSKLELLQQMDMIYDTLIHVVRLKVQLGENAGIDSIAALSKQIDVKFQVVNTIRLYSEKLVLLNQLIFSDSNLGPPNRVLEKFELNIGREEQTKLLDLVNENTIALYNNKIKASKAAILPDISGRFFSQRLWGASNSFSGFSVSLGVPLFNWNYHKGQIRQNKIALEEALINTSIIQRDAQNKQQQLSHAIQQSELLINQYAKQSLTHYDQLILAAQLSFKAGEISYIEMTQFVSQALDIKKNYLDVLFQHNQNLIDYHYYEKL
jgi:cobalt-zinc-cadmium resistance protein CzcA